MHHRFSPKNHRFSYGIFMFMLDLDELEPIHKRFRFLSVGSFNLFSFYHKDHANYPAGPARYVSAKEKILQFLKEKEVDVKRITSVRLLTNLTTLGYIFNPISVYYCYDGDDKVHCAVAEVCNTFGEMKLYFINGSPEDRELVLHAPKYFYVSPFSELDIFFRFIVSPPVEKLVLKVDDYKGDDRFLTSCLSGERLALTDKNMLKMFFRFPLMTLRVITLIHWQALKLYLKKVPFFKKDENSSLQQKLVKL